MRRTAMILAIAMMVSGGLARAADPWGLERGTPDLKSADRLAFGPEDILFVGDTKSAAVFAVATGNTQGDASAASINIENLPKKVADVLGAGSATVNDIAVNPATGNVFAAVTADDQPAIIQIDGAGKITKLSLEEVRFAKAGLSDAPEDKEVGEGRRRRNNRGDAITDLAWFEGKVLISGLSTREAPSTVRELNFPFADSDHGTSVEIFHAAHGRDEDYAAVRTFVPMMIDGEPSLLAAYVCTPLVKIPLSELEKSSDKVKGTTVAELGNRNQPLDMITYEKNGREFLLLSNSARGVMKITTAGLSKNPGLTEPVSGGGTAGQTYDTVEAMQGVVQMDKLNSDHAVILVQNDAGAQSLKTVALP
ncbi:MAG: hypothetical protein R3C19_11615 [Planctomycetaceae bacterium]